MTDSAVSNYGIDSSGRAILMTAYMADWFEGVVDELGFRPVIIQGAWMSRVPGGGAADSAGYHDAGGCLDLRTRDLTAAQSEQVVRTLRRRASGAWRRDARHGMDPHLHLVLGSDHGLTANASAQWREYLAGGDGLEGSGKDYEWRPNPIVKTPPEDEMRPEDFAKVREIVREELDRPIVDVGKSAKWSVARVLGAIFKSDT